ncbi:penicillin acylase family protein [Brevibacillus borstelensis]|uniref:penicillin acylase family protein n=1 Tax=Brevibacillus borstelensis TaxID=45462 RepID=UPI002E1F094D|nr:penicillin acylase family protein [Brevibacillus borstelensis]
MHDQNVDVSAHLQSVVRHGIPKTSGELKVAALHKPVHVYRDHRGVPHIEARTAADLYLAQGFVTAQERMWQMDMSRRLTSGRLSEVMGSSTVNSDKLYRKLQLKRAAEDSLTQCSPATRKILDSFSQGVNAYLRQAVEENTLPLECNLLGYQPEFWTPIDTLLIGKLLAASLSENMKAEVYRHLLRNQVGDELAKQLWPVYPADGFITISSQHTGGSTVSEKEADLPINIQMELRSLLQFFTGSGAVAGSNGWVVSGKLTKSGKPLLANDPHLGMDTPSIWFQTHLHLHTEEKTLNVIGVTLPGVPGVVLGHNDSIAWGVTNAIADTQDLYIEKFNSDNPHQVYQEGKWEDVTVVREVIEVKGEASIPMEVRITRHGPVLTDHTPEVSKREEYGLSLRWTAYSPGREIEAFLEMNRAENWEQFKQGLQKIVSPALNVLFASNDGTIAFKTVGAIPIRAKGDGLVPVPGWMNEYEWNGFIPFEKCPEVVNPEEGFIVAANNKIVNDSYPYLIAHSWDAPYRANRIAKVLRGSKEFSSEDMRRLQADLFNEQATTLLPALLALFNQVQLTDVEQKALQLLQEWNYQDEAEQAAPLMYHLWFDLLRKRLYEPKLGPALYQLMADGTNVTDAMLLEAAAGRENDWIKQVGGIKELAISSFISAVQQAVDLQGENPQAWRWGEYHRIRYTHPLAAIMKSLGIPVEEPDIPMGGSRQTVCLMGFDGSGVVGYGAPWRQVVDLSDLAGNSFDIVAPGQSGHVFSCWYSDQAVPHAAGELCKQWFAPEEYRKGDLLVLHP